MRRYRFRLEQVLHVRRQEQDVARAAVLEAASHATAQAEALADRDHAYAAAVAAHASGSTADFLHEQAHRAALGAAVLEQRRRLEEAQRAVQHARSVWTAAAQRVGALERLDERQRAEHTAQTRREDEMVIDDLVVSRSAGRTR